MAAKRKYPPPKPDPDRSWSELTKAERNAAYTGALHAYALGQGPNPQTQGQFFRERSAAQPKG